MRKFKGQSITMLHYILLIACCVVGSFIFIKHIGSNFGEIMETESNKSRDINTVAIALFENPKNILSSKYNNTKYSSTSNYTPIETVIRQNMENGEYLQTSGSSGRINDILYKETVPVTMSYVTQIDSISAGYSSLSKYVAFSHNLADYIDIIRIAGESIEKADCDFDRKVYLLSEYVMPLNHAGTAHASMSKSFYFFLAQMHSGDDKRLLRIFRNEMFNFTSSIEYEFDDSLYIELLGTAKSGTFKQDCDLVDELVLKLGATPEEKEAFSDKIKIMPTKNYHDLASKALNNDILCGVYTYYCDAP